jgi:hypothetical protein
MQQKAVRFLSDVVGDPDRADEFESMTPEEYAQTKGIQIKNPTKGKNTMAAPTRAELEDRVAELEDENQNLNDKLDSILDIASDEDSESDDLEDDNQEDDSED